MKKLWKGKRQIFISASESESGDPIIEKRKLCNLNYESDGKQWRKVEQFLWLNPPKHCYEYNIFLIYFCWISGSNKLDDSPFKLYKNSTSVSNSYSDQMNFNVYHNYKGQKIQQNDDGKIFPISCKYSKK